MNAFRLEGWRVVAFCECQIRSIDGAKQHLRDCFDLDWC